MATRSNIAVRKEAGGKFLQVYCHWDGHFDTNGRLLLTHYNSHEKALELVSLGDMSSLGERAVLDGEHSFEKADDKTTVYYGRDRGEKNTEPEMRVSPKMKEEYLYVFDIDPDDGVWKWFGQNARYKYPFVLEPKYCGIE